MTVGLWLLCLDEYGKHFADRKIYCPEQCFLSGLWAIIPSMNKTIVLRLIAEFFDPVVASWTITETWASHFFKSSERLVMWRIECDVSHPTRSWNSWKTFRQNLSGFPAQKRGFTSANDALRCHPLCNPETAKAQSNVQRCAWVVLHKAFQRSRFPA